MFEDEEKKEVKIEPKKLKALRDFKFSFEGKVYDLKKGEAVEVPSKLLQNLKTEKVIK